MRGAGKPYSKSWWQRNFPDLIEYMNHLIREAQLFLNMIIQNKPPVRNCRTSQTGHLFTAERKTPPVWRWWYSQLACLRGKEKPKALERCPQCSEETNCHRKLWSHLTYYLRVRKIERFLMRILKDKTNSISNSNRIVSDKDFLQE